MPLQATLGLILSSNILLLSSFVLSGYGAFLLAAYLLGAARRSGHARGALSESCGPCEPVGDARQSALLLAPIVAGLLYAFASSKLFYAALGQWNIASSQWIPFYVLYLLKTGGRRFRWRYPVLAALFLLLQAYAELTYASFLVLFTLLWRPGT